jgi:hypothetical protein
LACLFSLGPGVRAQNISGLRQGSASTVEYAAMAWPGGTDDSSPALQCWVRVFFRPCVPNGTIDGLPFVKSREDEPPVYNGPAFLSSLAGRTVFCNISQHSSAGLLSLGPSGPDFSLAQRSRSVLVVVSNFGDSVAPSQLKTQGSAWITSSGSMITNSRLRVRAPVRKISHVHRPCFCAGKTGLLSGFS